MKEIVQWLLTIEHAAADFYGSVAAGFSGDERVSRFFEHLAADEAWHLQVMETAVDYLESHSSLSASITVDEQTKERIESTFSRSRQLISSSGYNLDKVLDCLAVTEFSEWNDIFIYVVNTMKSDKSFSSVAAQMTHHLREIEHFLDASPQGRKYLHIVKSLPPVWQEQILIIDDDPAVAEFLKKLLTHTGQIELAGNGKEGLRLVKERYFDAIICDVEMPVMDGIEFFRRASEHDPTIDGRILFFTRSTAPELMEFFRERNLRFMTKPAPIRQIVKEVAEIVPRANRERKRPL